MASLFSPLSRITGAEPRPFIRNTANGPREFHEGEDVLLTCVVANLGNHTVWWSKHDDTKKTILTVADRSITSDERVSLLHDKGKWCLLLQVVVVVMMMVVVVVVVMLLCVCVCVYPPS